MLRKSPRPIVSVPTLAEATGFPVRSIPSSTGAHVVVLVAVLLLRFAPVTKDAPFRLHRRLQAIELQDQTKEPLLPEIRSASSSGSSPAGVAALSAAGRNAASSAWSMPLIHQRRQHIISNTPDATNPVQTILQPDIEHAPRLTATLPIPSMVRMAAPQHPPSLTAPTLSAMVKPVAPPAPAPVPKPPIPKVQQSAVETVPLTSATELVDSPKLAAYATSGRTFVAPKPAAAAAAPAKPSAPVVAANSAPSPASTAKSNMGTDKRNLLVVNAFEVQATMSESEIPAAEIHGRFEVTASPSLPEGPTTGGSSSTAGVAGSGLASAGSGAAKGLAHGGSGAGTAAAAGGRAKGAGGGTSNVASSGHGNGHGIGSGVGEGSGHGAAGSGNGNGNGGGGSGASPFAGMTIVGGSGASGLRSAPANAVVDVHDPHGGYGMTIVSSGRSGGGVRDFGVFNDGPTFTVYLDVSKLGIHGARWSLQYGASREVRNAHPGVALTPPLVQDQRLPQLPAVAVAANVGRQVIVRANLTAEGKLDEMRVMESPDERLNGGVLDSLTHWYFEPAAMGGEKVAVKVLLGIAIAPAMADNGVSQQAERVPAGAVPRAAAQ